jgi:hypothetical protein
MNNSKQKSSDQNIITMGICIFSTVVVLLNMPH